VIRSQCKIDNLRHADGKRSRALHHLWSLIFEYMNPMIRFAMIGSVLLVFAHRSPAPISEPNNPTPAPQQSAPAAPEQSSTPKPKPKHSPTATPVAAENEVAPIVAQTSTTHSQKSSGGEGARLIFSPPPSYPVAERFGRSPVRGSGEFRVTFGPNGAVVNVQIVRSMHRDVLNDAAIAGLRRWRSRPGAQWSMIVPVELKP
jgi:outer membrane biosynthesis protein TonB